MASDLDQRREELQRQLVRAEQRQHFALAEQISAEIDDLDQQPGEQTPCAPSI